jgi:hypothetical protein
MGVFKVGQNQRSPVAGPALLGLAAVAIACMWIYLLFAVIGPAFR